MPSTRAPQRRRKIKKNPQHVAATGWAWLMIGLLMALFFGGAVRALLSERQVRQWIERTWTQENPPYNLSFSSARVELSDGWRPHFGLRVLDLELTPKDPCQRGYKMQVDDLFLPGPIAVLWGGTLRFGQIVAQRVNVEKMAACAAAALPTPVVSGVVREVATAPGEGDNNTALNERRAAAEKFLRERWALELENTSQWLSGVRLLDVRVTGLGATFDQLKLHQVDLNFAKDGSAADLTVAFGFEGLLDEALAGNQARLQAHASASKADLRLHVPVREGRVTVNAAADLSTLNYIGEFNLDFVPATSLVEILKQLDVITDPISLKRSWLAGQGRWQGRLLVPQPVSLIYADHLKLSGDAGSVQVQGLDLSPQEHTLAFKPFIIRLDHFSLRYLIEALGRKGYTGVISDFGQLSGDLQVDSPKQVAFRGEIENMVINFSRQSVRATQKVNSLRCALELRQGRVSGMAREFELDNGTLRGHVSFNLDRQVLNGLFQIKVDELQFQPEVQRLMTGGQIAPIALYGQGQMSEGHVKQWSGEIGSKEIIGSNWRTDTLKIRSEFANQQMILQLKANGLKLFADNDFWQRFKPVLAKSPKVREELSLKHLSARFEVSSQAFKWRNASASTLEGDVLLATAGQADRHQVEGTLSLDFPTAKMVRWVVIGPWNDLQFSPAPGR
ncbi:MAG: hypothetical protein AB7N80_02745 [Bdellovibrionales bacterium]